MTDGQSPAPGWYPAPHADNQLRYWTGTEWVEPPTAPGAAVHAHQTSTPPRSSRKTWIIGGSIAAGVLVVGAIGSALGGGRDDEPVAAERPASSSPVAAAPAEESPEPVAEPEPEPEMVTVPDLAGSTADAAADELIALGLDAEFTTNGEADVTGTDPRAGVEVEVGSTVIIEAVEKPQLTAGQENAISKALSYLEYTAFSRTGLIEQLEFEGFTPDEATFAVDTIEVDWNVQAAAKAADYMDYSSFSRQSLIEQLMFEGFSEKQAAHGAAAVGF